MTELSDEEKHRIYQEEKIRIEARNKAKEVSPKILLLALVFGMPAIFLGLIFGGILGALILGFVGVFTGTLIGAIIDAVKKGEFKRP